MRTTSFCEEILKRACGQSLSSQQFESVNYPGPMQNATAFKISLTVERKGWSPHVDPLIQVQQKRL